MLFAVGSPEHAIYAQYAKELGYTHPLPPAPHISLRELAERFDGFFLDSYGVLNRAEELIPHAAEGVAYLKSLGKTVRVLTNNAALSEADNGRLLRSIGLPFEDHEILCSGSLLQRERASLGLEGPVFFMGMHSSRRYLEAAGLESTEDPQATNIVVMASSRGYRMRRIALARQILSRPGSLLVVLNPDAVAPRPRGVMARVSGTTASSLQRRTGCKVELLGKPFRSIYEMALERTGLPAHRCIALGDTLATDILGGRNAGLSAGLVLTGVTPPDRAHALADAERIWPDFLVPDLDPLR